jgi:hypothetical protein
MDLVPAFFLSLAIVCILGAVWGFKKIASSVAKGKEQQSRADQLLAQEEINLRRHAEILDKWFQQAERIDALIDFVKHKAGG